MKKIITAIFILSVIAGLVSFFRKGAYLLGGFDWGRFNITFLLLSLGLYCLVNIISFFAWRTIYQSFGKKAGFKGSFKLWNYSLFGKYSVLALGQPASRIYFSENFGLNVPQAFAAVVLEQIFLVVSAFLFIAAGRGLFKFSPFNAVLLVAAAALLSLFAYPPLLKKLLNAVLRLFKKDPVSPRFGFLNIADWILIYIFMWVAISLSFYFLLYSAQINLDRSFISYGMMICAAFLSGYFVPFVPAGLGVREGVLGVILAKTAGIDLASAVFLAFIYRLVVIGSEVLCFLAAKFI